MSVYAKLVFVTYGNLKKNVLYKSKKDIDNRKLEF